MEVSLPPMSARTRWSALSIAIPLLVASSTVVHAGPWSLAPGEFYTEIRSGWFSSDTYHDQDGNRRFLAGGGLWEQRGLLSYTEFGWKPRLSFVLGIPVESVSRRFGAASPQTLPTTTGIGDGLVGLRYRLTNGRSAAALELGWKPPFGYERERFLSHTDSVLAGDTNGDGDSLDANVARQIGSPVLGDGQQDVTLSLLFGRAVRRGFVQVGGGYRYRFEEPKDQIVLSADLGLWVTRSVLLAGRYEGVMAAGDGDRPTDEPEHHRVGPMLVYRVDDHMDLFVATMHTAAATNALHTDEVHVGFAFRQTKLNRLQGFLGGTAAP